MFLAFSDDRVLRGPHVLRSAANIIVFKVLRDLLGERTEYGANEGHLRSGRGLSSPRRAYDSFDRGSVDSNVAENCGIVGIAAEDGTEASEFLIEDASPAESRI